MRRIAFLLYMLASIVCHAQIIADHTVVDRYDDIPQQYIDEVKKMLVDIAGESHSLGYRIGMNLLELYDSKFQVTTYDGSVPGVSSSYLRLGRHGAVGEAEFYTSSAAVNAYKSHITSQNTSGNPYSVIGFGWCWDMTWQNAPGGIIDPVHQVRWAGSSVGGPNGNLRWGLDAGDQTLTGNSVCMDTYLNAVEQYIQHCISNGYATKVIFTTGPVDDGYGVMAGTENGFQREIKHDYIRNYVRGNSARILFDYADILCWNNSGVEYITNWNDGGTIRPHANIHPDNMKDYDGSWNMISHTEDGDHIGEVGALRLAKAMWWMLARLAGWDGGTTSVDSETDDENDLFKYAILQDGLYIQILNPGYSGKVSIHSTNGTLLNSFLLKEDFCLINTSELEPGIYILTVQRDKNAQSKKIAILQYQ